MDSGKRVRLDFVGQEDTLVTASSRINGVEPFLRDDV